MKKKGKFFAAMLAVALILCLVTVALAACGDKNTQKHEHTFAEEWSHNDDYHWHAATCGHTDQVQDKASHDFDWQEVTPASCDQKGRKKGTCECGYVTYEDIEMTAHTLTPGWTWSGYTSATLKLTCTECEDVIATVPATLSSESGSDACAEYTLHTATATYDGETYTNSKREESVSHHTYALSEWKWDDDLSGAVAVLVCERDATHVYESARVSSEENDHLDPTCTENGYTDYKVRLELDGATYEGTKQNGGIRRKEIDALGHDFDTEWLHNASEHWHKCSHCTETDAHIAHTYTDGICACGYAELTPEDEFVFSEIDGKWAITGYRGNRSVVIIPATYRGRDVVELGMGAFYGNTSLKHVVIPDAITSMRDGVFDGCVNIEEVTSPAIDLSSIPKDNLKKLTITSGTRIEAEQFKDYTQLAELSIAETVTYIGKDAFANTAWLNDKDGIVYINKILYTYIGETPENFELTIEDDTVAISPFAFEGKSIYQITISTDVPIGADAFKDTLIQRATIPASAIDAIPKADLRYLEITSGTTISQGALKDCKNLQELVLPFVGGSVSATSASASTLFGYLFASVQPTENANYYREIKQQYGKNSSESVTYYIPSSIRNVTIKGGQLLYGAFYGCSFINTLNIGDDVTIIAKYAFISCTGLQTVTIGKGVLSIGEYAFSGCTSLQTVTIGSGVQSIGEYVFKDCTGLQTLTIGKGVTSIGYSAFRNCTGITKVNVASLKTWCEIEFGDNTANPLYVANSNKAGTAKLYLNDEEVTEVKDLDGLESISGYAFYDLTNLTSVTIPDSVTSIGRYAFWYCTGLSEITIPNSVQIIGYAAFYKCTGLQTVTIGKGVQSIGNEAFSDCTGLQTVNWNATNCTKVGVYENWYNDYTIFKGCTKLATVNIGEDVQSIPAYAFFGCAGLHEITIPDSVQSIGSCAFEDCTGLQTVTIGENVQSIGGNAFSGCTEISSVTIPKSVESIGDYAFSDCTALQRVNWNATNCTKVGVYETSSKDYTIFKGCTKLATVNIGEDVQSIPAYAFFGRAGLHEITIPGRVTSIGEYAFGGCTGLSEITIPASVQSIGDEAFSGCTGLKSFDVAEGNNVFQSKDGVLYKKEDKSIYLVPKAIAGAVAILDGCTSIGRSAFSGCTGLQTVTIGEGMQSIGDYAFSKCTGLQTVNWNATNCTEAGSYSNPIFKGCTGLTTVNIGENVQSIPSYAFSGCTGLKLFIAADKNMMYQSKDGVLYRREGKSIYLVPKAIEGVITILDGCTSIGYSAFSDCTSLKEINLPDSVTSIGNSAFYKCTGLQTANINVQSIDQKAFSGCTGLQTVTIGENVQSIGDSAFSGCTGLQTVNWNATNCTKAGSYDYPIFNGCTGLTTVNIGENVQSILDYAFRDCTGLSEITIPNSVQIIGYAAFYKCTGLQTVTIPDSVQSIGTYAFYNCTELTEITIPESVTSIGNDAFEDCTALQTVNWNATNCTNVGGLWFNGCTGLTTVNIGENVQSIPANAFRGRTELTEITIPESVTSIGSEAFRNCTGLQTVNWNATNCTTAGSSGYQIFNGCTKLTTVNIGENVQSISSYAFYGCKGINKVNYLGTLKGWCEITFGASANPLSGGNAKLYLNDVEVAGDLNIPTEISKIGGYAFYGLASITSVTIPDSVTSIGNYAFYKCTGLQTVTIPNSVTSIRNDAFSGCTNITTATMPASAISYIPQNSLTTVTVTSGEIQSEAFYKCTGLQTVTIGEGVQSIGNSAFSDCTGLSELTISDNVTSIGSYAFCNCTGLQTVTIGLGVQSIGDYAFRNCTSLQTLTLGEGLRRIDKEAFYGCAGITSVKIPDSVTSIGNGAFNDCTGLQTLTLGEGLQSIGDKAFYNTGLKDIYYAGDNAQWGTIKKGSYWNDNTPNYQLHYNSTGPAAASAASNIATLPSEQAVLTDCDKLDLWAKQN